jgi:dTDP-4-amino-4,6-dideoxygalactose transaminase
MSYKIPLFKLDYDESELKAVTEVINSRWISQGPKVNQFEENFSKELQINHSIALSNCTTALHLALRTLDIKDGDEVICPSLTFVATCNAVRYVGATPVFADIEADNRPVICPKDIEKNVTEKTKAVIVMHYGGFPCDMLEIKRICSKYGLKLIEDACHAPLSEFKGKKLGTYGDVSCFSFFSNKNIGIGEGGMICTNNDAYASRLRLLRSHGMTSMSYERSKGHSTTYDVIDFGYNYRMDDIRASLGIIQLQKHKEKIINRSLARKRYINGLTLNEHVTIPFKDYNETVSNYIFPIFVKSGDIETRDRLRDFLHESGIQTSLHYPAVHAFSVFEPFYKPLTLTERYVERTLTLPLYSDMAFEDIDFITDKVNEFFASF